jgi:hypothetical protein
MHLLPPQVELDPIVFILTLATLAIAWLACSLAKPGAGGRRHAGNPRMDA